MSLANEINKKLDEMLSHQRDLKRIKKEFEDPNFEVEDAKTGEIATQEQVLDKAEELYSGILGELKELTPNKESAKDLFTNIYYINDFAQDRAIMEEEVRNKLQDEYRNQNSDIN